MSHVFVLNPDRTPLEPVTSATARVLLSSSQASVFKRFPFTIIRHEQQPTPIASYRIKIDPGSKTTGLAILNESIVVWAGELSHRGQQIVNALSDRASIRRNRRSRKTRYRAPRWANRTRCDRWIPPSLRSRVANIVTWTQRLMRLCPVSAISMESVRFDLQKHENPEISGVEYQRGTLHGFEVKEYLLEKWQRKCAYCGVKDVPLQIEHIQPKSKGGVDSVRNLAIACGKCNQAKGSRSIQDFLKKKPDVLKRVLATAKAPLKDAAAVNVTRRFIQAELFRLGVEVECSSGGRTKFNRTAQRLPKTHWLDAACVGASTPDNLNIKGVRPLLIKATGYGNRRMQQSDKYGFPKGKPRQRAKWFEGFRTGDMAIAIVPKGKNQGKRVGRVTIRSRPLFMVGKADGIHPRYMTRIQMMDGYDYGIGETVRGSQ